MISLNLVENSSLEVDGGFGDEREEFEGVAVVEAEVVFFVVEDGSGEFYRGFGHC